MDHEWSTGRFERQTELDVAWRLFWVLEKCKINSELWLPESKRQKQLPHIGQIQLASGNVPSRR